MAYQERIKFYEEIESLRNRPLLVYVTNLRQNASGQMSPDAIPHIIKQISHIPEDKKTIDIFIVSNGGEPLVSWRIISILRERFERIGVLIPYTAYSAATLLALGADEIIMHPYANLGPVDPQLVTRKSNQERITFAADDLLHFMDFVKKQVGISDQEQMERTFEMLCKEVGAIPIGVAQRSTCLALSLGEKLLNLHMKDKTKVKTIAEALNRSFYHHGYPLGRREASEIGLPISNNIEVENFIWKAWEDIEEEIEVNIPFDLISLLFSDEQIKSALSENIQVNIPSNLPNNLLQQVYNNILSNIKISNVPSLEYNKIFGVVESIRCRSVFEEKIQINATKLPDMSINIATYKLFSGWKFYLNSQ